MDGPVFPQNFAMSSTSRQIRAEFMPLYFKCATIQVKIQHVQRFLETFCPVDTAIQIEVPSRLPALKRNIDLRWLMGYVLDHSDVRVSFQSPDFLPEYAKDLKQLFEIAKSTPAWRKSLSLFEAIRMVVADRDPWLGESWHIHMFLKTEHSPEYFEKNNMGLKRTHALLQRLNLRSVPRAPWSRMANVFDRLIIEISRID